MLTFHKLTAQKTITKDYAKFLSLSAFKVCLGRCFYAIGIKIKNATNSSFYAHCLDESRWSRPTICFDFKLAITLRLGSSIALLLQRRRANDIKPAVQPSRFILGIKRSICSPDEGRNGSHLTDRVKSPGLVFEGRAKKLPSTPRFSRTCSASTP